MKENNFLFHYGQMLVVLGKGIRENEELEIESKLNTIAAGLLCINEGVKSIVFSGGQTRGKQYISEAESMQKYFFERFPLIPKENISVEPKSIDTYGNIVEMLKRKILYQWMEVPVLSVSQHLRRTKILFRNIAHIRAKTISSQAVLKRYGTTVDMNLVDRYEKSRRYKFEIFKEIILNLIVIVDPRGKMLRYVTKITRHGE